MDQQPPLSPTDMVVANLRAVLLGLKAALGGFGLAPLLGILLHNRIGQTLNRVERMLVRFRAGKLWLLPQRVHVTGQPRCRTQPSIRLPRRFGWLLKSGQHHAAGYGLRLRMALDAPEMAEMLASSEQARRILRPLCRALAIELPWTVDKIPEERGVMRRRTRRPRPQPEPFRIPLPRGVLAWARREGFGKMR